MQRHRVVVIGAGFGGLFAIKALRTAPVDFASVSDALEHLAGRRVVRMVLPLKDLRIHSDGSMSHAGTATIAACMRCSLITSLPRKRRPASRISAAPL